MYAFSNTAGDFANNRAWSVGADYVNGPVRLDAAYSLVESSGHQHDGRCAIGQLLQHQSRRSSATWRATRCGVQAAHTRSAPATVALLYTNSHFDLLTGGSLRFANYEASVRYQFTPGHAARRSAISTPARTAARRHGAPTRTTTR